MIFGRFFSFFFSLLSLELTESSSLESSATALSDDLDIFLEGPGTFVLLIWVLLFLILLEFDLVSSFFFPFLADESDASSALFGLSY